MKKQTSSAHQGLGVPAGNGVKVIIETPKGSRNKFKYDPDLRMFKLSKVLPEGMVFPYDFGFVPSTKGDDGDPVDVLFGPNENTASGYDGKNWAFLPQKGSPPQRERHPLAFGGQRNRSTTIR